ncbi:HupE/UreJ family protein [Roseicella frigidaeris]|uniref:HupE/UreJ family protein n=1 Tax=Roseicella frigidaeris TaxID=2230885 RepID=UPI000F0B574C|nr:HupE/UreJ family protein [Roseicella frigidaeris]
MTFRPRRAWLALLGGLALLLASLSWSSAHVAGRTGYADVSLLGSTLRYRLTLGPDALAPLGGAYDSLPSLIARHVEIRADGTPCAPVPGGVAPPSAERASLVATVDYACPAGIERLTLRDDLVDRLGPDFHTLARIALPDAVRQFVFEPDRRVVEIALGTAEADPAPPMETSAAAFFRLGIEHILTGFDHLLFLGALLLRGGGLGSILGIVTAFTLAHSLTLALAVLRIVSVPPEIVEPLIALSIVYVAAENLLLARPSRRRWIEGFAFGLVHGLGFAGALLELELPREMLVWSLLAFNLGVEAGQLAAVALLLPVLAWLQRAGRGRRATTVLAATVLTAGLALLADRILLALG